MKKLIYFAVLAAALVALVAPPAWAAEGDEKFKMHGEIRLRGDHLANLSDFDDKGPSDDQALFWPSRARLAFEGQFTKNVSAWFEIQNGWVWGGTGAGDNGYDPPGFARGSGSELELYQANITLDKLWSDSFSLTFGRQELVLGTELLLGDNDFYMGWTHDGLVGEWDLKITDVTLWYFRTTEGSTTNASSALPPPGVSISAASGGMDFYGAYSEWTFKNDQELDVYLMYQDVRTNQGSPGLTPPAGFAAGSINNITTFGARYGRDVMGEKGFLWNIEYAVQFGDWNGGAVSGQQNNDLEGEILEAWLGYNFNKGDNNHRIYGRWTSMSGDDDSTPDNEGFFGVAGDIHDRLGKGDWFILDTRDAGAWPGVTVGSNRGIDAWSIGYNGFFNDRHEFGVAYWDYSVNEMGGIPNTPASDDLGNAYDIWYGFNYTRNVAFEFSYSALDPGDFLLADGDGGPVAPGTASDSATRTYGQVRFRF